MRNFLDDYVETLDRFERKRAAYILDGAKVEKSELSTVLDRVTNLTSPTLINLTKVGEFDRTNAELLNLNVTDVNNILFQLYLASEQISLLLDSNQKILLSEISALEKELNALEKGISNYAFLLADGKSYDYAYLETFNDGKNMELDPPLTDRAGLTFAAEQVANIHSDEGILAIPESIIIPYPLTGQVLQSNCNAYITSDTGIQNALNINSASGWRVSISSPAVINSQIVENISGNTSTANTLNPNNAGALFIVELTLDQRSPCDTIKITPFVDSQFKLLQISTSEDSAGSNFQPLLDEEIRMVAPHTVYFPLRPVSKIRIFLQQDEYTRQTSEPETQEWEYRLLVNDANKVESNDLEKINNLDNFRMIYILNGLNKGVSIGSQFAKLFSTPLFSRRHHTQQKYLESLLRHLKQQGTSTNLWVNRTTLSNTLLNRFKDFLSNLRAYDPSLNMNSSTGVFSFWENESVVPTTTPLGASSQVFRYDYNIGIKSVLVGGSSRSYKGVFVSKIIPAPGDIGEVRLKTIETNYAYGVTEDKDAKYATSIEHSVTNISNPTQETDWIPILPVETALVENERIFPDHTGYAALRFNASLDDNVIIYRNGYKINIDINSLLVRGSNGQFIVAVRIPLGEFTPEDIFTVDYRPSRDYTTINFEKYGFGLPPLATAYEEDGPGERFNDVIGRNLITLESNPYVDYAKVEASTYVPNQGLNDYSPVLIRFDDGTVAKNLTNYQGGVQSQLNSESDDYQFLQNGNTIIFNKTIAQNFRAFYQYLPSNVRIRSVLRVNDKNIVSPKLDLVQLKAKVRKADAKKAM